MNNAELLVQEERVNALVAKFHSATELVKELHAAADQLATKCDGITKLLRDAVNAWNNDVPSIEQVQEMSQAADSIRGCLVDAAEAWDNLPTIDEVHDYANAAANAAPVG